MRTAIVTAILILGRELAATMVFAAIFITANGAPESSVSDVCPHVPAPRGATSLRPCSGGISPPQPVSIPLGFRLARLARLPLLATLMVHTLPRSLVEQGFRSVYGDPSKVTQEQIDRSVELTQRAGNRRALLARARQRRSGILAERIPELKLPTLILWGGRDPLIPPEAAERLHREIAGSTLVMFEDLGHAPEEEDPAGTVASVKCFLGMEC